jgi:pimeloyl-ACP methyl ester carboxylesterase
MLGGGTYGATALAPHARLLADEFQVIRLQTLHITAAERLQPLPPEYSVTLESAAMARELDRLNVPSIDLFGWSYGGLIAFDFALHHADRVRTLSLFEPPVFWVVPREDFRPGSDMELVYELGNRIDPQRGPDDEQHRQFLEALGSPPIEAPPRDHPSRKEWDLRGLALRCLRAITDHTGAPERLQTFTPPVLMMIGVDTVPFHHRISTIMADTLPNADLVELPGTHIAPLTAREEFVTTIRNFIHRRAPR